jgi:hypothetical protein
MPAEKFELRRAERSALIRTQELIDHLIARYTGAPAPPPKGLPPVRRPD